MAKFKIGVKLLSVLTLWCGAGLVHAAPAPTPAQMMQFKPRQTSINLSTPSDAELAGCKVELAKGQKLANGKTGSGWTLKDPQGRMLRRFFDSDGDNQIDVWSYYMNGDECYREMDSNLNGKVDQYRWLSANGSKWGVDLNEDGKVDSWKAISAEEVSQEVLAATLTRDFPRLQALMITKADMDALELPESEINRLKAKAQTAATTFQTTANALAKVNEKTRWVHLETSAPECTPADVLGSKVDLIRHRSGTILFSDGDKINDFLQTGEMVLVGRAWRIVEAPIPGGTSTSTQSPGSSGGVNISAEIKTDIERLKVIDDKFKDKTSQKDVTEYNLARAEVIESIVGKTKDAKDREEWIKQLSDCYSTAAQNGEKSTLSKLADWQTRAAKDAPGSNIAAYVSYRHMSAEYAIKLESAKPADMPKLQDDWKDRLTKFVSDYPACEDTPDAVMQLGMVAEFVGKETEAKNWYTHLVKNFDKNPMAPKAAGAIRRLGIEGQEMDLVSQTLGAKSPFDIKSFKGKSVIVYYWASWNSQCVADFAKLKAIMATHASKGVELVCVNLDANETDAAKFLQGTPVTGTHLYQTGGLESPLAVNYGIMVLPNLFLVGGDGKVVTRNAQVATVEDELKKLTK